MEKPGNGDWFRRTERGKEEGETETETEMEDGEFLKENALLSRKWKRTEPRADTRKWKGKRDCGRREIFLGDGKRVKKRSGEAYRSFLFFLRLSFSFSHGKYLSDGGMRAQDCARI